MDVLLDTHTLMWFLNGDSELPVSTRKIISTPDNRCFVSIASIWEIAIKLSLKKLKLKSDFNALTKLLLDNEIEILPIQFNHVQELLDLPYHHRDPFDRVITSQSRVENLVLISRDKALKKYKVKLYWA
jgi:PIN domain nuclease of toxin-antitoxin system